MENNIFTSEVEEPLLKLISVTASEKRIKCYVIGGFVRDLILNRPNKDIDIMVVGNGIEFAKAVAKKLDRENSIQIFKNFGTAMIRSGDIDIEFVGARKESYRFDSRKPIVENGTLEDDQNRRDFTINAMAISLNTNEFGQFIDPFNGLDDLKNGIIKTPLEPELTFTDDPLRIMRAIRFAAQLDFDIDPVCFDAIKKNVSRIKIVSKERISDELNKIILSPYPSTGFNLLSASGVLKIILPWIEALKGVKVVEKIGHKDNFEHTLQVLDKISMRTENLWLRWAALLHDVAKPMTKKFVEGTGWTFHGHELRGGKMAGQIFKELRLPMNEKLRYVQKLISLHLRPARLTEDGVTASAVRRLLFDAGDDIDDLMMLAEADITSKNSKKVDLFMQNFELLRKKLQEVEKNDRLRNWQPPITGEIIMETFDLPPCHEIGVIKAAIREAILEGIIPNDFEQAYQYMISEAKKIGIEKKN